MSRSIPRPTAVVSSLAGVTGIFLLAGCSAQATVADQATTEPTSSAVAQPSSSPTASESTSTTGEATATSTYADGTYTAEGSYSPQAGLIEAISVTITLQDDVITAVEVSGDPQERESVEYQSKFIGGIADEVVAKSIDKINVSRVAGSSLTSGGFNQAIETIKAEAAA
ncbi:hypothetical protein GCM10009860_06600 [Microbacterium mitrae]|uniref:FMN-binding protein n=1 Tax=Microbacterium mitrae TaxID=664640 RepID=A0A5C8HPV0_9MICO|nr:hypothetical protein [Microbacterium mitrae]TXK06034.1 hypothetical protein FVP60_03430 [Microbacterium mitrae]